MPASRIKEWYLKNRRDFPWRGSPTPYEVLVSEMMLHQTQASVVVAYFERWMRQFPTLQMLSCASREEVIKAWEGLGYYARARNLHEAAITIMEEFDGRIPDTADQLSRIRGIGPYTVGAILAFAFKKKAAAVDGNVQRVLSRYFLIEEDKKSAMQKKVWELADGLLPDEEPWMVTEGLIELGALVCTPRPKCPECPLQQSCKAYLSGKTDEIPAKGQRQAITSLFRPVAVIESEGCILVRQERAAKLMQDLYEFPYVEVSKKEFLQENIKTLFEERLGLSLSLQSALCPIQHSFTRFRAHLFPFLFSTSHKKPHEEYIWILKEKLASLPFSSGHRDICKRFSNIF